MVDAFNLTERCEICRFWNGFRGVRQGECRKKCPVVTVIANIPVTVFPGTTDNWWCGEFEKMKKEGV